MTRDPLDELGRLAVEPLAVTRCRDAHRLTRELLLGQPVLVLPAGRDEGVDERVAGGGVEALAVDRLEGPGAGDLAGGTQVVAGIPHGPHQPDDRDGGVEPDRVADAGVLRRVGRQHDGDLAVARRDVTQSRVVDGQRGQPRAALGVGCVVRKAFGVDLLEREDTSDDPAVELGHGDLGGDVGRRHAHVTVGPLVAAPGEAQALNDRHVQSGERLHVPRLVVFTGAGRTGLGATGRQHRGDEGVVAGEVLEQVGRGVAQRGDVDGYADTSGDVDRVGKGVNVGRVLGRELRSVEEDGDTRTRAAGRLGQRRVGSLEHAPFRQRRRRGEALTGHEQGVAEKRMQLAEVRGAPLCEVAVRLRDHAGCHRRKLHQRRVRGLFPAEHDHRLADAADAAEPVAEILRAAEDTGDHDVGGLDGLGHRRVAGPRGVGDDVVGPAATSTHEVGV